MKFNYFLILLFFSQILISQNKIDAILEDNLQYGIAAKLNIELQTTKYPANFKLSISAGVGYNIDDINLLPTLHTGIILFNRGVIGSSFVDPWNKVRTHFFYSIMGTVELDKRDYNFTERYVPLYHFSDFTANPLQNPYKSSLSFGRIWIKMQEGMNQKVGVFNLNVLGRAQITYYNDGGPVLRHLGDKLDRHYTGGIVFSYHGNEKEDIDLIEVSYHKFTGYARHAFDIGDKLQMDFLVYADKSQLAFNHQRWKINVSDLSSGYSGNISLYDFNALDVQDFIHFNSNVPYHPDYFNGWRLAIGGRYEYNYLRIKE